MDIVWQVITQQLSQILNRHCDYRAHRTVSGGCINQSYLLQCTNGDEYFVKLNRPQLADMFAAEFVGLQTIYGSHSIRVPQPYCSGSAPGHSFIVMQSLRFGGRGNANSMREFGRKLAAMHRNQETQGKFGWELDNTIGSTPQINSFNRDWVTFWRDNRLGYQLRLAAANGYRGNLQQYGEQVLLRLNNLFPEQPAAAMLHGDLWSGNYAVCENGEVAIFDPAFYFGDRETDIAMTELFGGFSADFYAAYNEAYPLAAEYAIRKTLYNSYHIINHLNLFGLSYLRQAESMLQRLISELH